MRARVKGINLLPKEYIQAEQIKLIQMVVSAVLVLEVFAFIGGVAIPPKIEAKAVQEQLDEVGSKLNDSRFADVNKTIQELEVAKADVEQWVTKYGDLKAENFVSSRVLDSLTSRLPIGMAINTISITPGDGSSAKEMKVEGSAQTLESILNYVTIIEGIYGLGNVHYEGTYDEELMVYKYKMDIKIPVEIEVEVEPEVTPPAEETEGGAN